MAYVQAVGTVDTRGGRTLARSRVYGWCQVGTDSYGNFVGYFDWLNAVIGSVMHLTKLGPVWRSTTFQTQTLCKNICIVDLVEHYA